MISVYKLQWMSTGVSRHPRWNTWNATHLLHPMNP